MPSTHDLAGLLSDARFYANTWGSDPGTIQRKKALAAHVLQTFVEAFGHRDEAHFWQVPGRLEFTAGKHTDYVGLPVPNFAIDRGFMALSAGDGGPRLRIVEGDPHWSALSFDVRDLARDVLALDVPYRSEGDGDDQWRIYPITNLQRVYANFRGSHDLEKGAALAFASDLPPASGMSSSSALMIATFLGYASVHGLLNGPSFRKAMGGATERAFRENMALYLACCENGSRFVNGHTGVTLEGKSGVGTFGGSQDHVAILLGRGGYLSVNDYCPIRHVEDVAWPEDLAVVVCCAQPASKSQEAKAGYNDLRERADLAARACGAIIGQTDRYDLIGEILRDHPDIDSDQVRAVLRSRPEYRTRGLAERWEIACVQYRTHLPIVVDCLRKGDYARLGEITNREHAMSCVNQGNITPVVDVLQKCAVLAGAYGATGFGGGFGGSLFALVSKDGADDFIRDWKERSDLCLERIGRETGTAHTPEFFEVSPVGGACEMFVSN